MKFIITIRQSTIDAARARISEGGDPVFCGPLSLTLERAGMLDVSVGRRGDLVCATEEYNYSCKLPWPYRIWLDGVIHGFPVRPVTMHLEMERVPRGREQDHSPA